MEYPDHVNMTMLGTHHFEFGEAHYRLNGEKQFSIQACINYRNSLACNDSVYLSIVNQHLLLSSDYNLMHKEDIWRVKFFILTIAKVIPPKNWYGLMHTHMYTVGLYYLPATLAFVISS